MNWGPIDYPIVAGIAALCALPLAWFVFRNAYGSVDDELDEVAASPNLGLFGWIPDWVGIKLIWVLAGVTAVTVAFYKLLVYFGVLLGFVA